MKDFFGCGIIIGIVAALIVCAVIYFFVYSRSNPEDSERKIDAVESGWQNLKSSGDKGLDFVRRSIPRSSGEQNQQTPEVPAGEVPSGHKELPVNTIQEGTALK